MKQLIVLKITKKILKKIFDIFVLAFRYIFLLFFSFKGDFLKKYALCRLKATSSLLKIKIKSMRKLLNINLICDLNTIWHQLDHAN